MTDEEYIAEQNRKPEYSGNYPIKNIGVENDPLMQTILSMSDAEFAWLCIMINQPKVKNG